MVGGDLSLAAARPSPISERGCLGSGLVVDFVGAGGFGGLALLSRSRRVCCASLRRCFAPAPLKIEEGLLRGLPLRLPEERSYRSSPLLDSADEARATSPSLPRTP